MLPAFLNSIIELITRTSTDLPPDVRAAMAAAMEAEEPGTRSAPALAVIAQNIDQAADCEGAICQDTGMPTFEVQVPVGSDQIWLGERIREAIAEATRRGKLRPNSVVPSLVRTRAPIWDRGCPSCTLRNGRATRSRCA